MRSKFLEMATLCTTVSCGGLSRPTAQTSRVGGPSYGMTTKMNLNLGTKRWLNGRNSSSAFAAKGLSRTGRISIEKNLPKTVIRAIASPSRAFQSVPGFSQLAEPVPQDLSLLDIVKTLPQEVFEIDDVKAWKTVVITVSAVAAGYAALAVAPWYLYPLVYAYLGTAVTGMFVVAHDCGHLSFSNNKLVNDVVGTVMMAPLIYPFEPWRIKHNTHHAHTNKLIMDTAWQPFRPYMYDRAKPLAKRMMEGMMGPFWWVASVGHWLLWHFDLTRFKPQDHGKVKISWFAVGAFIVGILVPLLATQGPVGFVKWWFLPWLGFHFWMSTFTMVHHTAPHIPFKQAREWNAAEAQLAGTVHCDYPAWVEFLCHDISVHIPHHVSSRIPSYNLRKAYASIKQNFDKHLNKAVFGPELISSIIGNCQLYDTEKKQYVRFERSRPSGEKEAETLA